eukprot:Skav205788  [mRNA]  locus=scaffold340:197261:201341:+ [translate_table: standard]
MTLRSLIEDWNSALEARQSAVKAWNAELLAKYQAGEMLPETLLKSWEPEPQAFSTPSESWIRQWKASFGWSTLTRGGDEQAWLSYNSTEMEQARNQINSLFTSKNVHKFLCLNYDQLWRNSWGLSKHKLCYKHRRGAGRKVLKTAIGMKTDKKVHAVKGARQSVTAARQQNGIGFYVNQGQMDVFMTHQQMDPAPAAKAGSSKAVEPWKGKDAVGHEGQQDDEDKDGHPDDEMEAPTMGPWDAEMEFVTVHGSSKKHMPPAFFNREVFLKLHEDGFAVLPDQEGFMLSYHNSTHQWHARCADLNANYAPSWGAIRTELQAILAAIEQLWKWYVQLHPGDADGKASLKRIQEYIEKKAAGTQTKDLS